MTDVDLQFPGAEIVAKGLADQRNGVATIESLALEVVASRLRPLGFAVTTSTPEPELILYARLRAEHPTDAYGRYNSLLRRLDSFASARERAHQPL
jgi:hypothetical protein